MSKVSLIISSPSGGGKTTICKKLIEDKASPIYGKARFSISATTRSPRPGEVHGRDYYFLSKSEFQKKINLGEFVEYANVFDNFYGTLKSEFNQNENIIFDIDVQGHNQIKKQFNIFSIFLIPPSLEILKNRMEKRGDLSPAQIQTRMKEAQKEISQSVNYDFGIINNNLEKTFEAICSVILFHGIKSNPKILDDRESFLNLSNFI